MKYALIIAICSSSLIACGGEDAPAQSDTTTREADPRTRDTEALRAAGIDPSRLRENIDSTLQAEEERRQRAADEAAK